MYCFNTYKNKYYNIHRSLDKNSLNNQKRPITDTGQFTFLTISNGKTVKNIQIDPQTTEMCSAKLNVTLLVSECVCDFYLIIKSLTSKHNWERFIIT